MPVRTTATRRAPKADAADAKRTSAEGHQRIEGPCGDDVQEDAVGLADELEVPAPRRDPDDAGNRLRSARRLAHVPRSPGGEPLGERPRERRRHVLGDAHDRVLRRKAQEELAKGRRTAGRGGDDEACTASRPAAGVSPVAESSR